MARPWKYTEGHRTLSIRVVPALPEWMEEVGRDTRLNTTATVVAALELYLTLRSPQSRPAGYELSEETRALLAELKAPEPSKPPE